MAIDIKNDATLATNLDAYWTLDEASGTRSDSHTGGYDLTDTNTVGSATGLLNNGADFEASNEEYFSNSSFDVTGDFSISAWVNFESFTTHNTIATKGDQYKLGFYTNPSGNFALQYKETSGSASALITDTAYSTGTWYHAVVTVDVSQGYSGITVYIDGSSVATTQTGDAATSIDTGTKDFLVGARHNGAAKQLYCDGVIDELGIWSKVLTSGEVTDLYNSGTPLPYEAAGGSAQNSNFLAFF